MTVFHAGCREPLKASVHGVFLGAALVCLGYNLIACALRRERHLAVNVLVYGSVVWFETRAVAHHRPVHTKSRL